MLILTETFRKYFRDTYESKTEWRHMKPKTHRRDDTHELKTESIPTEMKKTMKESRHKDTHRAKKDTK